MSSVYLRYLLPALVVAVCAALALLGRRRRARDRAVEDQSDRIAGAARPPNPTDPASEQAWWRLHASAFDDWMSDHESFLEQLDFSEARADLDLSERMAHEELDIAGAAHPNPQRRAELSALRAAARSTLAALAQGDYERARRHHLVYCDYRDIWREQSPAGDSPAGDSDRGPTA
ncbi:MAG: hypothetical protein F4078_03265 [Acidimicrobiia bacterium]|nr:hypothetical protein [Acidimicrobiia bacterium]